MSVKVIYGDVYSLLTEWLHSQRRPFLVIPNVTAGRALEDRLTLEGRGELIRHLVSGRIGRLAAELVGPGEDISTIDLVIEREILRGILPSEYRAFGAHDPFMDQVVRELDDLRRNCSEDTIPSADSLLADASVSAQEREAFGAALRLMKTEAESVAGLQQSGLYLGADLARAAIAKLRTGARAPWSGIAVSAVHRLDAVSRELLLVIAQTTDIVFFPGPASPHVRSIVQAWHLSQAEEVDRTETANPLVRRYILGAAGNARSPARPTVDAFPDRDREIRGVIRAIVGILDGGATPQQCLVTAPRADTYTDAVATVCSEFEIAYYVGGLRFFSPLPIDRLSQSILRYLTAPAPEAGRAIGEIITRSGLGFAPFRATALRDRVGALVHPPQEWTNIAKQMGWPETELSRLQTLLDALAKERVEWQSTRPATEWAERISKLLTDLGVLDILGRDIARRGRSRLDAELAWEGQGTSKYLDRVASFRQTLAAGTRAAILSWERMPSTDFVRLFTSEVSFGSFLPSQTDANAIRFLDIEDTLLQQVDHLWVIDFAEGVLPLDYPRPFLIPERVREHLARNSGMLTRNRHLLLQRGNFEKVFPVPRRALHLSYPYQDERAHTRLPSPFALTYGLLTGAEVQSVIAQRRQAHEYSPRVPAEQPTAREAVGLVVRALHSPMPPAADMAAASAAGAVRNLQQKMGSKVEAILDLGALFLAPSAVVNLRDASGKTLVLPDPITADELVDSARCPFRLYARAVLRLFPPHWERWPEDPLRAVEDVLAEVLAPNTWPRVLEAAGPLRLRFFREAAQRAVAGERTVATRGFQEYVARQAYDYMNRFFVAAGANGGVRKPLPESDKVRAKVGPTTVESVVSRVDEVEGRRIAVLHVASAFGVERMWNGAFQPKPPVEGGDPRPGVVSLGVEKVHSIELHSLTAGKNPWERLFERASVDRDRETKLQGEWDPKIRHLGSRFDRDAFESVKAAVSGVLSMIEGRRFEIRPQPETCGCCAFGALCQRRWVPFPVEGDRS